MIQPPEKSEYNEFYQGYINTLPKGDIVQFLEDQKNELVTLLHVLPEGMEDHSYADGKWTIKQVVRHIIDTEMVFLYRVLAISRDVNSDLPGMNQDVYVDNANDDESSLAEMIDQFDKVRETSISMIRSIPDTALTNHGKASGFPLSVRAGIYILAGHAEHHKTILTERYL